MKTPTLLVSNIQNLQNANFISAKINWFSVTPPNKKNTKKLVAPLDSFSGCEGIHKPNLPNLPQICLSQAPLLGFLVFLDITLLSCNYSSRCYGILETALPFSFSSWDGIALCYPSAQFSLGLRVPTHIHVQCGSIHKLIGFNSAHSFFGIDGTKDIFSPSPLPGSSQCDGILPRPPSPLLLFTYLYSPPFVSYDSTHKHTPPPKKTKFLFLV